ncbi:MAG: aminopeptidase, partial [Ruminococcus sp.]|nr:aminopeptidase [Ruminococcus sp.]
MSKEKSEGKLLKESLLSRKKNALLKMDENEVKKSDDFCEDYKKFLDLAKTEREAVEYTVDLLEKKGFVPFKVGMGLKAGDKVYVNNRGKAVIAAVIGSEDIRNGVNICAAHIDSPRLDLKQCPVYEDAEMALFKTHYYGGIKKYQWTAIPLALHGVIIKADGTSVKVSIGEEENDPVFCVNDLLPHLAADQMKRNLAQGIKGEELNIVIGSRPFKEDGLSEAVKLNIMKILNEKYGIVEDDFLSAELEA